VDMAGFQPSIFWLVNSQATVRSQAPSLLPGLFKCQTFGPITSTLFFTLYKGAILRLKWEQYIPIVNKNSGFWL
jgi:hypothetical protein